MSRFLHFFSVGFFLLVLSCKPAKSSLIEKIITSENGDFRGVLLHSSPEEIKQREQTSPGNEDEDYLFYEIPLPKENEYYTIGYSFNEKGLYEILLDVYLNKPEDGLLLFLDMKEYFASRHGTPKQEDDATIVWTVKCKDSEEVELTLSDESSSYNAGKVSVSFYDLSY